MKMNDAVRVVTTAAEAEDEREETRPLRLFRAITLLGFSSATFAVLLSALAALFLPAYSFSVVFIVAGGFMVVALVCRWLSSHGRHSLAVVIYLATLVVGAFVAMYFLNGASGPMAVTLVVIPMAASLIGERRAALWMTAICGVLYAAMVTLEWLGVLQPQAALGAEPWAVYGFLELVVLAFAVLSLRFFSLGMQRALQVSRQRGLELAEANRQSTEAARAEREARERQERAARDLRQAVQDYTVFLKRVEEGKYETRLLPEQASWASSPELVDLGHRLNATVETLVTALRNLQIVQRRLVREAWTGFLQAGAVPRAFRVRDDRVVVEEDVWMGTMPAAAQRGGTVMEAGELALPLRLRGEVIGVVGARRDGAVPWSQEDLQVAEALVDQLAQTIENLRLLDESQRLANRERLIAEVAARLRASLDPETVLRTTVREVGRVLGAELAVVEVAPPRPDTP